MSSEPTKSTITSGTIEMSDRGSQRPALYKLVASIYYSLA